MPKNFQLLIGDLTPVILNCDPMLNFESLPSFDLEAQLLQYAQQFPNEDQLVRSFLEFYHSSKDAFSREHLVGHFTASAILLNPTQDAALMTLHRKLDKWLQLGGHADGETNLYKVALTEAWEESGGIPCHLLDLHILDIDVHTIPARPHEPEHQHWDFRFLLQAEHPDFKLTNESKELAWVAFQDNRWLREESLARLSRKAESYLAKK